MRNFVFHVVGWCAPIDVVNVVVGRIAVDVATLLAVPAGAVVGLKDQAVDKPGVSASVGADQRDDGIALFVVPRLEHF